MLEGYAKAGFCTGGAALPPPSIASLYIAATFVQAPTYFAPAVLDCICAMHFIVYSAILLNVLLIPIYVLHAWLNVNKNRTKLPKNHVLS